MSRTTRRLSGPAALTPLRAERRNGWGDFARAIGLIAIGALPWVTAHAQQPGRPAAAPAAAVGLSADARASTAGATAARAEPSVNLAFFYASDVPVDELQAFDAVVLDPAKGFDPAAHPLKHTVWIARTDGSDAPDAPADFVAGNIEPLWQRGYRGFLLDTPHAIAAIDAIHAAHPDARLIVGGPNALQAAGPHADALYAVVGESLVRGLDETGVQSIEVPDALRERRIAATRAFIQQTGVPVVSLEYCAGADRECARTTAARVTATGIVPFVTDVTRDVVGIGAIEVLPRKVLIVQDRDTKEPLDGTPGVRDLAMPLNYLGYDVEYADFDSPLPAGITPDRYAGVVAWFQRDAVPDAEQLRHWVAGRITDHVPIVFLAQFGFDAPEDGGAALDLEAVPGTPTGPVTVVAQDPMVGFETSLKPDARDLAGVRVGPKSRSLLRVSANGTLLDQVAITPWGGYALSPYTVESLVGVDQERWVIEPIAFLSAALRLQTMPSPSVTTENGRRLFMTHVDGDGFASRAEFPGADFSGEALYQQIFTRYKVPMTLSVIEGEVGAKGLHPDISPRLEQIARKMFALPNVAIGTHTYSHPFQWDNVDATGQRVDRGGGDAAFSLNIPGYKFNIDREITGSIDYINERLAPAGKKTVVLQWSGDCQPPGIVVRKVYEAGVFNINGGDTVITKTDNSWTNIAPIGVDKGPGAYQVYAPNQDENVYTNEWLGPFYGFTRVLETFDMTEKPRRFKPIDVYYHMYSGTKVASLRALDQIFTAVLKQPVLPVHITDYVSKVLDWRSFAVARGVGRHAGEWLVRGNGFVRELHWPKSEAPALASSVGLTGFAPGPDGTYIHLDDGNARFSFGVAEAVRGTEAGVHAKLPYIAEANGFVRRFERTPTGLRFEFGGYYQPFVKLADAQTCSVSVDGRAVSAQHDGGALRFDTVGVAGQQVDYRPVEIACGH